VRFLAELIIFSGFLLLCTVPVSKINQQLRRFDKPRKWYMAAAICALTAAIIGWSSRVLVEDCLSEINDGCIDIGGQGLQFVIVGGYAVVALATWKMTKDS